MSLPPRLREQVEAALQSVGLGSRIEAISPLSGGCINNGAQLLTDSGSSAFLKWHPQSPPGMFTSEVDGLEALRTAGALRVPNVLAVSEGEDGAVPPWLLLQFISTGTDSRDAERRLGEGLAELHESNVGASFGWSSDNWIGSLPQVNALRASWADFWWQMRLAPQLARARSRELLRDDVFDRVQASVPVALGDVTSPCLVHGDLWGGNTLVSDEGEPVLIDPAVYRGHGEVDLAMSELFGGFGPDFYDAYSGARPISTAYSAYRRDLYQLYYLMVHVNLFGSSYEAGCRRAAQRVVDELA